MQATCVPHAAAEDWLQHWDVMHHMQPSSRQPDCVHGTSCTLPVQLTRACVLALGVVFRLQESTARQ